MGEALRIDPFQLKENRYAEDTWNSYNFSCLQWQINFIRNLKIDRVALLKLKPRMGKRIGFGSTLLALIDPILDWLEENPDFKLPPSLARLNLKTHITLPYSSVQRIRQFGVKYTYSTNSKDANGQSRGMERLIHAASFCMDEELQQRLIQGRPDGPNPFTINGYQVDKTGLGPVTSSV